jgi:alanine dehydrogenase
MNGLNVHAGKLTYEAVANAQDQDFTPAAEALAG